MGIRIESFGFALVSYSVFDIDDVLFVFKMMLFSNCLCPDRVQGSVNVLTNNIPSVFEPSLRESKGDKRDIGLQDTAVTMSLSSLRDTETGNLRLALVIIHPRSCNAICQRRTRVDATVRMRAMVLTSGFSRVRRMVMSRS